MNIYTRLDPFKKIIDSDPNLIQTIKTTYNDTENKNPSVRNMEFRKLFESLGIIYHKQGYSPKEIFWRAVNNDWEEHVCVVCGVIIDSKKFGTKHCGSKCAGRNPDTLITRINTTQKKFGVDNVFQATSVKETMKETCQEKYGVDRYQQTSMFSNQFKETAGAWTEERKKEIHSKKIDTWQKNYGVDHGQKSPEIQDKTKKTNLERYGVENPIQCPEIREKLKQTNLERYGVENVTECPEIYERAVRNSHKRKTYIFPSGKSYIVQGYEPKAIDLLIKEGYTEDQIQLINRPSIKYFWSSTDGYGDDKWHVYHPDIIIPHETRIIEVKSTWTYDGCGNRLDWKSKNQAKKEGAILSGYSFEFMIF